ncbi:unnamed protein product [Linum tenue]|uniref:PGG domain-containing protein n=1 Tax=Linum tenue TaxID=586396 RepID=A0AAV0N0A0_9ROSI|nr:unnamed protein product [Linum tenue]
MEAHPELAMTVDLSNTTALHTAAMQGHIEIVNFLLEAGSSIATIARSNGKTALHSAARNGHVAVVRALVSAEPAIAAPFMVFFLFDSVALFISLAVVVVQTSVVVIESKAKKRMMAVINKLMWIACVLISVAFLALSFVVVGESEMWLAVTVAIIGTVIMATTLGTMCYWVIKHRIELSNLRSIRRNSMNSRSLSFSASYMSDSELLNNEFKNMYAI